LMEYEIYTLIDRIGNIFSLDYIVSIIKDGSTPATLFFWLSGDQPDSKSH